MDINWRKMIQNQDINTAYNMCVDNILVTADEIAPGKVE